MNILIREPKQTRTLARRVIIRIVWWLCGKDNVILQFCVSWVLPEYWLNFLNCVIVWMLLVPLQQYCIQKYHDISHELKQKDECHASKAHKLMHAVAYSNQTLWGEYLQSIWGRLSVFICDCCWLMSLTHCLFKIYVKWMDNSTQRVKIHALH